MDRHRHRTRRDRRGDFHTLVLIVLNVVIPDSNRSTTRVRARIPRARNPSRARIRGPWNAQAAVFLVESITRRQGERELVPALAVGDLCWAGARREGHRSSGGAGGVSEACRSGDACFQFILTEILVELAHGTGQADGVLGDVPVSGGCNY